MIRGKEHEGRVRVLTLECTEEDAWTCDVGRDCTEGYRMEMGYEKQCIFY